MNVAYNWAWPSLDFWALVSFLSLDIKIIKLDEDGLVPKDMIASCLLQNFKRIEDPKALKVFIEYYEEYSTLLITSTDQVHFSSCFAEMYS